MAKFYEAVRSALYKLQHRDDYVYLYGCKGKVLKDEATIRAYMDAEKNYFSRYSEKEKNEIVKNSLGKVGYDCSGLVGSCTGDLQWSTGQITNCSKTSADFSTMPAGSIIYTTYGGRGRHIGIDIGYGYIIHTAYESTDANIKAGKAGILLTKISDMQQLTGHPWEIEGMTKKLDYTGAGTY